MENYKGDENTRSSYLSPEKPGPEAIIRTRHGTMDWFKIGTGVHQGCILSLCLFAEYIMQNVGLNESQAGIKFAWKVSTILDVQMIPH